MKRQINIFFYFYVALVKIEFSVCNALFESIVCYVDEFWCQKIDWWLSYVDNIFAYFHISIFHQKIDTFYFVGKQAYGIIFRLKEYLYLFLEGTIPEKVSNK